MVLDRRKLQLPKVIMTLKLRQVTVALGCALGLLLGAYAIRGAHWGDVRGQIAGASPVAVVVALALTLGSGYVRAFRWRLLFGGRSMRTSRLFLVENAALGLNNISPVRLLDEPAIMTMLTLRDGIPGPLVVATLVMSRMQDLGVTLLFAATSLALEPTLSARVLPALITGITFIVIFTGLLNLGRLARRSSLVRRIPGIHSYREAVEMLLARKGTLLTTLLMTGVYWLMLGPMAYILAQGMSVELSLLQATMLIFGAIFFATAMPGLPGALGTFEVAVVELAGIWGVPAALALGYGLILHLVVFLPPVIIALLVLPREGMSFLRRYPGARTKRGRDTASG
jgi:uncharacterized protein (TIRG00374 family)